MRMQLAVLTGVGVVVLLTTLSLALYYRNQAVYFERECSAALDRLDRMAAVPQVEAAREPAAVSRAANDDKRPPPPRREPEPQQVVAEQDKAAPLATSVTLPPRSSAPERSRRRSSDWMENLRTNDPQRYAEFQQRRQAMQQNMQNAWGQANNYFMNRDTSKMNQADLEEYSTMLTLLGQAASLSQQLQSGLPSDVRQQVMSDLRSNVVAVAPLLVNERNREYYDAAVAMGQNEQDAADMVGYINQITSNTSLRAILPRVRGGGTPGGAPSPPANSPPSFPSAR